MWEIKSDGHLSTRVVTTFFSDLNWTLSSGASKNGALHSMLMTCWTWAPFSIVESIGLA